MNIALKEFHDRFAFRDKPPFAGSPDLLGILKKHVPDSIQYYLSDSWEKITIYNNKMIKATSAPTGNQNEFKVHLEFDINKSYIDSVGDEKPAGIMNDYIDIGIFSDDTKTSEGSTKLNPLYFKKHKFSAGRQVIDIIVKGKPVRAGIDPYSKLIDANGDDNIIGLQ
jgi:hypothetical protein